MPFFSRRNCCRDFSLLIIEIPINKFDWQFEIFVKIADLLLILYQFFFSENPDT